MVKHTYFLLLAAITLNLAFTGCTKDVDFDQIDDLELSPVIEASLAFIDASPSDFFVGGSEQVSFQDFIVIDLLNGELVNDNLIKADFVIECTNSISRSYELKIDFLNESDQLQHSFSVTTPASPNNMEVLTEHTEVFEGNTLAALKQTSKIVFKLTMLPGAPIDSATPGNIHFKSKVIAYFNYTR